MTSKLLNVALHVDENIAFRVSRDKTIPTPRDGELLIKTTFSGANPADIKHATHLGIYPTRLGYDFFGKVLEAAPGSVFKVGDNVAGYTPTGVGRPAKYGTHQSYLVCPENMIYSVPGNLPSNHAGCLTVVAMTAADTLYNLFKFPLPSDSAQNASDINTAGPLLIWGASTSVGICAVQFAKASGVFPILVSASPERHALLLELGATNCFDYKSPSVIEEINTVLKNYHFDGAPYAFDAVGDPSGLDSAQMVASCASQDAQLVSVVFQKDPRFVIPSAAMNEDFTLRIPNVPHPIAIPARKEDHQRAWSALQWAVKNYGSRFRLVSVEVFQGRAEDALEELRILADNGRGFGKLAFKHPLE
ncbi:alcohol dehydrogenase [Penicillium brasilianum]|uniref:Alcohol dehydrogenase n=1 Tax=Penicillium brasilianum TaxID=104259 RepID=A0A1S9RT71_PENBI|nr:alcohol dehydrogenase [Penicillium brasilianum]